MKTKHIFAAIALMAAQAVLPTTVFANPDGVATIAGTSDSSIHYIKYQVVPSAIDGKPTRLSRRNAASAAAGNRVVDLRISVRFGFNELDYKGRIPFRAQLKDGHAYETRAKIHGRNIDIWIADTATGDLASKVLTMNIERCYFRLSCPKPRMSIRPTL